MDHRKSERGLIEDHEIVWRIEAEFAAEVSPEDRLVRSTPCKLEATWPHSRHGSALGKTHDPTEDEVGQQRRWVITGEQPLEAQFGLTVLDIDADLLGAYQTLVPGELLQPLAKC